MWNQSSESFLLRRRFAHTAAALLLSLTGQQPMSRAEINLIQGPRSIRQEGVLTLPARSAIVGKVVLDIVLDPDRKYDLPVTMITSLPVYDQNGTIAIPTGTLITAIIQKKDGGDYITADSLVYRGINLRIKSTGRLIPAQVRPENYGQYTVPPKSKASTIVSSFDGSVLIPTLLAIALTQSSSSNNEGQQTQNLTPLVLGVVGIDAGIKMLAALLDKAPKKLPPLVEIPRETIIVFTLENETKLPELRAPETNLIQ